MNKYQAIDTFWNSFNIPAYDENTVPENAQMPYITYNMASDSLGQVLPLSATLWYRSNSWEAISLKADEIAEAIGTNGYYIAKLDEGYVWITKGTPFAQRIVNEDRDIRCMYINITVEFLSN